MENDRERQLSELLLLQSMYPDEFTWQTPSSPEHALDKESQQQELSCKLSFQDFTLELTLPSTYPSSLPPQAYLHCAGAISTATRKAVRGHLASLVEALPRGTESLDTLVTDLTAYLSTLATTAITDSHKLSSDDDVTVTKSTRSSRPKDEEPKILRLLFWTHHLLSITKRKQLSAWAHELSLNGIARPGHPGAIIVEGPQEDAREFEARIKALRWQALQVRGELEGANRLLGRGWQEVKGLDEVADILRQAPGGPAERGGSEELVSWFLDGMRIGH